MNIENILSFIYVYQYGSLQKAAAELYITQPTITSRIQSLEKELNCTLFVRNKNGAALTEDGNTLLPYALNIIENYNKAKAAFSAVPSMLTVGSIMSAASSLLPQILSTLHSRKKQLSVNIVTNFSDTLLSCVSNDTCAFAITRAFSVLPEGLTAVPVYLDPVSLIVGSGHRFLSQGFRITMEDVAAEPLICYDPSSDFWKNIQTLFHANNLPLNVTFSVDSMQACKSMILQKGGACFMPELSLEDELASGKLTRVSLSFNLNVCRTLCLVYKEKNASEITDFFVKELRKTSPIPVTELKTMPLTS